MSVADHCTVDPEPETYLNLSRPRDIEKILPMPLMHPRVWSEFANRFYWEMGK